MIIALRERERLVEAVRGRSVRRHCMGISLAGPAHLPSMSGAFIESILPLCKSLVGNTYTQTDRGELANQ